MNKRSDSTNVGDPAGVGDVGAKRFGHPRATWAWRLWRGVRLCMAEGSCSHRKIAGFDEDGRLLPPLEGGAALEPLLPGAPLLAWNGGSGFFVEYERLEACERLAGDEALLRFRS